jgi:hypothetical protein
LSLDNLTNNFDCTSPAKEGKRIINLPISRPMSSAGSYLGDSRGKDYKDEVNVRDTPSPLITYRNSVLVSAMTSTPVTPVASKSFRAGGPAQPSAG